MGERGCVILVDSCKVENIKYIGGAQNFVIVL